MSKNVEPHVSDETELHVAVSKNDFLLILELLSGGADVNTKDRYGRTPLHVAAAENENESHFEVAELLLKNTAEVNARDNQGKTPLYYLLRRASVRFVRLFLVFKADVNSLTNKGDNLLFWADSCENLEVLQLLIDLGLNVNHRSDGGQTPLHQACKSFTENIKNIKFLLVNGANMNAVDNKNYSPGTMAVLTSGLYKVRSKIMINKLKFIMEHTDFLAIQENIDLFYFYYSRRFQDDLWKHIIEHLTKLQVLNIPTSPNLLKSISKNKEFEVYYKQCQQELLLAKNTKIKNCWVSFFNLLVDRRRKLKNYAGNSDLVEEFEKIDCEKNFPIYGASMIQNVKKSVEKRNLFDRSCILLSNCLPIFNPNHLIISGILDCIIGKKDLLKFCE